MDKKFRTFEDLETYRVARFFRKEMYATARKLPDLEKFALADQVRRAAVSLTNNIAEGHGRYHPLDQIRFLLHARGSVQELLDDLNVCEDEKYLSASECAALKDNGWNVLKLINGYLRHLRDKNQIITQHLKEEPAPYAAAGADLEHWLASFPI